MVERAHREPTMEEIVVALRETRRGAGRLPPFTVVEGQPGVRSSGSAQRGKGHAARTHGATAHTQDGAARSTEVANLQGGEIARLLAENARLNERVVFLLKVIEHEQLRGAAIAARLAAVETEKAGASDVRAALESELRPVLLVLLRLLEKQRSHRASNGTDGVTHAPTTPQDAEWIVDLDEQQRP